MTIKPKALARYSRHVVMRFESGNDAKKFFYEWSEKMGFDPPKHLPPGTGLEWALAQLGSKRAEGLTRKTAATHRANIDRSVLVALKRQGGRGHISDIRKAAGLGSTGGDRIAKRLIKKKLLRWVKRDLYELMEEDHIQGVIPEPM